MPLFSFERKIIPLQTMEIPPMLRWISGIPPGHLAVIITPNGPEYLRKEEYVQFLISEYHKTYTRPASGSLYHLCPPPDDGAPCPTCAEYWRDLRMQSLYIIEEGWNWPIILCGETGPRSAQKTEKCGKKVPPVVNISAELAALRAKFMGGNYE